MNRSVFLGGLPHLIVSGWIGMAACGRAAPAAVAPIRLDEVAMTPVELVLTRDIPAGAELRLRQAPRLRPLWVGIYQVTRVTASNVLEPLTLRVVPTADDIQNHWPEYEQSGLLAIIKTPVALAAGTTLTVDGRKYPTVDSFRQRYAWREAPVLLERLTADPAHAELVSAPLIVRTVGGAIDYLQAYRKADGRLLIQAFDAADNPADGTGLSYTLTGDHGVTQVVPGSSGGDLTEVMLPPALAASATIDITDTAGRHARSSPLPRTLDGLSIFFGDIHNHTGFSDGDYPTADAVAWANHRMGLDFTGPADHISQQGDFGGLTVADYAALGREFEQPGKFCRLPALETSCGGGHQLLCARDFTTLVNVMARYVKQLGPAADAMDSATFYQKLTDVIGDDPAMIIPVHPLGHPRRWPASQVPLRVAAAEIIHGQDSHESHLPDPNWPVEPNGREESSLRSALAAGYRLGFIGDSDHHRGLAGQPMNRRHGMTAVQAATLDSGAVFDAIRARRCYATSGPRIVADATLNGAPIGSDLTLAAIQPRTFKIMLHGTAAIAEIQIIHCGTVLQTFPAPDHTYDLTISWTDRPGPNRKAAAHEYYYVRTRQIDGHFAYLSPFWIKPPGRR